MGRELGRFLEHRRGELGLSRRDLADRSGLSYPYISQLETGDREPAIKAMRALAPVLDVRPDELAGLVAGGDWATVGSASSFESDSTPRSSMVRPDGAGYTGALAAAGVYTFEDAWQWASHCGPEKQIVFEVVPDAR